MGCKSWGKIALLAVLALGLAGQAAWAQQTIKERIKEKLPQSVKEHTSLRPVQPAMGGMSTDWKIATWLMPCNEAEITLGKLAADRAKTDEVRKFAQMMVEDHTKAQKELEKFHTSTVAEEKTAGTRATETRAVETRAADTRTARPALTDHANLDFVSLHAQIGKEHLSMIEKDLHNREGVKFDECYIGTQIGGHQEMIATLRVLREHASPELRKTLDNTLSTAETHLKDAEKIMERLAKNDRGNQ